MSDVKEFSLPEQRHRVVTMFGGISRTHVVLYSTLASSKEPGRWTRRAADRATLCGSMRACVVGVDAVDWPKTRQPVGEDLSRVDCQRCRDRYGRMFPGGPR